MSRDQAEADQLANPATPRNARLTRIGEVRGSDR
jgi:hypothetical protein